MTKYIEADSLSRQDQEFWGGYCSWNRAIAEYFYTGRFNDKPVYLDINDQLLIDIGNDLKIKNPINHFKRSVKQTLLTRNLFSKHSVLAVTWRQRKTEETPPFIALLAFFSYVAEKMVRDKEYAAHNYYGRLQRELDLPGYDSQSLQKSYREISTLLWPLLNEWISAWDGELGIPTARALDTRKYVSTAISQALVREQDRNLLKKLFTEQGLTAGQRLRNAEMLSLLLHWASSVPAPNSLSKLLMREGEVRDKVVEIACSELEMWDGRVEEQSESGEKISFLHYLGTFKDYPSPKLSLFLSANISSELARDLIFSKSSDSSQLVFECPISEIRLEWLQDFGVSTIEPYEKISQGDALLSKIHLESSAGKRKFTRNGQPLCIMGYRSEIGAYQEMSRVSLGQKSLILVHASVKAQVLSLIEEIARSGYLVFDSNSCKGIPDEWSLLSNVQIIKVIQRDGLDALVPLQDSSVNLSGGISLGYDTWLTSKPPEVAITIKTSKPLFIEIKQTLAFEKSIAPISFSTDIGTLFIALEKYHLADGDYELNVFDESGDENISKSAAFKLRSSNCIRLYKTADYERLSHVLGQNESLGAITAERNVSREADKTYLSGLSITSEKVLEIDYDSIELQSSFSSQIAFSDEEDVRTPLLTTKTKETNSCIVRGNHVVVYPEVPQGAPAGFLVTGRCASCGLTFWNHVQRTKSGSGRVFQIRNIDPKKSAQDSFAVRLNKGLQPITALAEVEVVSEVKTIPETSLNLDVNKTNLKEIFDALCYLKEGRFEKFCSLIRDISSDLWYPYELIRQLSALGHIDIHYDLGSLKPKYWRVADPCIINVGEKEFTISGWQSDNFIELVKTVSRQLGAEVVIETGSNGLQVIKILNIDTSDLDAFASIVSEESDYPLKAEKFFGEKMLTLLPSLSSVMNALERVEMPASNLEYLDPNTRRWIKVKSALVAGGYRHKEFGIRYYYLDNENIHTRKAVICDARLVKYFSLGATLDQLISYKKDSLELTVPFGMDLPFIYERVAVSYSGNLPLKQGGQVRYKNIPSDVAGGLAIKLIS